MIHEFRMPDIGEGLVEATISAWLVPVGASVGVDQPVVEVETDKATTEIPTPFAGAVLHHGAAEGDVVPVGEILFVIGEPGERWPSNGDADTAAGLAGAGPAPIVGRLEEDADVLPPIPARPADGSTASAPTPGSRPTLAGAERMCSPLLRRLASQRGVDLERVVGSGPGGRVTREDVERAATHVAAPPRDPAPTPAPTPRRGEERRPLSRLRKTIAANLTRSWQEIPHVTSFYDVDAAGLLATRAKLISRHGVPISVDALVIKAVVPALRHYPEFNAKLEDDVLVLHHHHDVGIAVDAPEGLVVAVVRDAGTRSLLDVAADVVRLGESAKRGTLSPSDVGRQTFTISNIGAVAGGRHGTPIIPFGTAAILAVGRATDQPVVRGRAIEVAPVMPLSFSYDHRIADGATARKFMTMVVENLADLSLAQ